MNVPQYNNQPEGEKLLSSLVNQLQDVASKIKRILLLVLTVGTLTVIYIESMIYKDHS